MALQCVIRIMSAVAVSAIGLVLGAGVPTAGADVPSAQLKSAQVNGTTLTYTFALQSNDNVGGIWLTVRERDNPDNVIVNGQDIDIHPLPPTPFRDITKTIDGMPEGTPVCVSIVVWTYIHLGINDAPSPPSNQICTDPAKTATQADVALQDIKGRDDPVANQPAAYLIIVRNPGPIDASDVVVDISTSGVATFGDQSIVAAGWANSGFACSPQAPAGGETGHLHCTGGNLKKGADIDPAVIVAWTGPGFGAIHAQVSGAGDTTPGNNGTAKPVQVMKPTG
jgi:hypothetical protein